MICENYKALEEKGDAPKAIAELIHLFQTDVQYHVNFRQLVELAKAEGKFDRVKFGREAIEGIEDNEAAN